MRRKGAEWAKKAAIELIDRLPDDATTEDIMAELYFKEQVDRGPQPRLGAQLAAVSSTTRT